MPKPDKEPTFHPEPAIDGYLEIVTHVLYGNQSISNAARENIDTIEEHEDVVAAIAVKGDGSDEEAVKRQARAHYRLGQIAAINALLEGEKPNKVGF